MTLLYRTQATAIGGRSGAVASADGSFRLPLARPREMGGKDGQGTNPEQLFAASYAACFLSSLRNVAQERGIRITDDANVTADVSLGQTGSDGLTLDVALDIDLPNLDPDEALALAREAHRLCPYSKAINGNVEVRLRAS